MSRRSLTYIVSLCALAIILMVAGALQAVADSIAWRTNFASATAEAQKTNKPLLVDFYTSWCGWCKQLDSETYTDARVVALSKSFVCVKLDAEKDRKTTARYKVTGYPTIVFLNSQTKELSRIVGFRDAKAFATAMQNALNKAR